MATDVMKDFQERLDKALEGLEVPEKRRKVSLTNLQWLIRNLSKSDSNPTYKKARGVLIDLLRNRKQAGL